MFARISYGSSSIGDWPGAVDSVRGDRWPRDRVSLFSHLLAISIAIRLLAVAIIRNHRMSGLVDLVKLMVVRPRCWEMDCTFVTFMHSRRAILLSAVR